MALIGLFILAFVLVSASAEPTLDEAKQPEFSAAEIFNAIESTLKRISRSADVEERFGLISGSVSLVRRVVGSVVDLVRSIIRSVVAAIRLWFLGPDEPTPGPWGNYYNNLTPTLPPYVRPGKYYGLPTQFDLARS